MQKEYTAYFYPIDDDETCNVEIPALNATIDLTPEKWSKESLIVEAQKELDMLLFINEQSENEFPPDVLLDPLSGYRFSEKLVGDSERAKKTVRSIKRIDIGE